MSGQLEFPGMPGPIDRQEPAGPAWDEDDVRALLHNPDASPADLPAAFSDSSAPPDLRDALPRHPALAGIDVLRAASAWPTSLRDRLMSVIDHRDALDTWANSPDPFDRAVAAMNPHCPADIAEQLAVDPHPGVRANAACNPHLSPRTRARLAHRGPEEMVRAFVAWLIASDQGRAVVASSRYAQGSDDGPLRVIAYGMDREDHPPV